MGNLIPKVSLKKSSSVTIAGGDKKVHIFPKGINPKVITRLDFEFACFVVEVQRSYHYATEIASFDITKYIDLQITKLMPYNHGNIHRV